VVSKSKAAAIARVASIYMIRGGEAEADRRLGKKAYTDVDNMYEYGTAMEIS
jgi:hypothetical protein